MPRTRVIPPPTVERDPNGYAALRVRVDIVEREIQKIDSEVRSIHDAMATRADITNVMNRLESLSTTTAQIVRPNYNLMVSVVGVAMVFLTMIGGFAYWPIAQEQHNLKSELGTLRTDIGSVLSSTIQQQRYNADTLKNDARMNGFMTKEEFKLVADERRDLIASLLARLSRIEELFRGRKPVTDQ